MAGSNRGYGVACQGAVFIGGKRAHGRAQWPLSPAWPDGERVIIVMANSEQVYVDGKLLKRGFNEDYVIDYNQAEVTFMPNVLITRFSRIRVDFEFAGQNFSRSILSASHRQTNGKTAAYFEVYREKDNPFRPLAYQLTDADRQALVHAGDDPGLAVISGAGEVGYSGGRILYAKVETIDNSGQTHSMLPLFHQP